MIHDPLGDAFTKIRNASRSRHPAVDVRFSRLFGRILDVLKQEGFIRAYKFIGETATTRNIRVYLKYARKTPAITEVVRISKPGARIYRKATELPRVLGGLGVAVISTSRGIVTEQDAFKQRIGGEVLCYVW